MNATTYVGVSSVTAQKFDCNKGMTPTALTVRQSPKHLAV